MKKLIAMLLNTEPLWIEAMILRQRIFQQTLATDTV